eukprot:Plantae.Rhodophyta-Purpureofilum_apyrenoidigerum.ctg20642.p1 GENE.Plantae.Rhodophyta-Purpureofilum_apyrenoidigerum.ctg20642~~Plantae.Rhodophyta-Purpureofilum_apyrenoidigerum.ctg20642.p1  ORF type:complete len:350 (-),score=57.51 Plantae.Rhodophyta-Purpureofilum_apyrenoidigerum.ctg20642:394-1443(-)
MLGDNLDAVGKEYKRRRVSRSTRKRTRGTVEDVMEVEGEDQHSMINRDDEDRLKPLQLAALAPDSVPRMVMEIKKLIDYVQQKPLVQEGTASFMRDYIRTLLVRCSKQAEDTYDKDKSPPEDEMESPCTYADDEKEKPKCMINTLPDYVLKKIFDLLNARDLSVARRVCKSWKACGDNPASWKRFCLERWRSLETDRALWKFLDKDIDVSSEDRWRKIYPTILKNPWWRCKLQKTNRFVCNLIVHQVRGEPLGEDMPPMLRVERRFQWDFLSTVITTELPILYFEPETDRDRPGFENFIQYLIDRQRAGLAEEDNNSRRFIFIPPCPYTRERSYEGDSLLGVVQLQNED